MTPQDQQLLDKQLHSLNAVPRNDGVLMLAILAVFLSGMALGGFLFAFTDRPGPTRIAMNDTAPVTRLNIASPVVRR